MRSQPLSLFLLLKHPLHFYTKSKACFLCCGPLLELGVAKDVLFSDVPVEFGTLHLHQDTFKQPFLCELHAFCAFTFVRCDAMMHTLLLLSW